MKDKGKGETPAPDSRPVSSASVRTGTLLVTLALCSPALLMLVGGTLSLQEAALRCAAAVLVGWIGVGCLTSLLRSYAQPDPPTSLIGDRPPTE
ncbi:MAG: hypothetical protein H7323_00780 [Frankiales bacterium]|nr:hypothetical protein [Frankiales bacterium]